MKEFKTRIISKKEAAQYTIVFGVQKPSGYQFIAGQYLKITLPNIEPDELGNWRWFSIVSAPYQDQLAFIYRTGISSFKKNITPETSILISEPIGVLKLPEQKSQPILFIAGGVGIAPIYSMILQDLHEKSSRKIWLFYSNRRPEDTTFLNEFKKMESPNFAFVPTMTKIQDSKQPWSGETGYIDKSMINRYLTEPQKPIYYIVGFDGFVNGMVKIVTGLGVEIKQIKVEKFIGL